MSTAKERAQLNEEIRRKLDRSGNDYPWPAAQEPVVDLTPRVSGPLAGGTLAALLRLILVK